ncbi:anaerobic benzoate catabolism transcriptional regulator [compost metagenome]
MTWEVIDIRPRAMHSRAMSTLLETPPLTIGLQLRKLRQQAGLSQLDLALHSGISQRHLSCLETGRARPSPAMLDTLLSAMDTPLAARNSLFLTAGFAPRYAALPLADPGLEMVHEAITHILKANDPAPAIVLDSNWNVIAANAGTAALLQLVSLPAEAIGSDLNLLTTLLAPGGLGDRLLNAEQIRRVAWQRASREALDNTGLAQLLARLPVPTGHATEAEQALPPVLITRLDSSAGELCFLSTFTTFGMPQDITVASLRIEHLIPADAATWTAMQAACPR